jgi:hypothetical protein
VDNFGRQTAHRARLYGKEEFQLPFIGFYRLSGERGLLRVADPRAGKPTRVGFVGFCVGFVGFFWGDCMEDEDGEWRMEDGV